VLTDEDLLLGDNSNFGVLSPPLALACLCALGSHDDSLRLADLTEGDPMFSLSQQPSNATGTPSVSRNSDNHSHQARREDITISRGGGGSLSLGGASAYYSGAASHYTGGDSLLGEDEMFDAADQNQLNATFGEQPAPVDDMPEFYDEPMMDEGQPPVILPRSLDRRLQHFDLTPVLLRRRSTRTTPARTEVLPCVRDGLGSLAHPCFDRCPGDGGSARGANRAAGARAKSAKKRKRPVNPTSCYRRRDCRVPHLFVAAEIDLPCLWQTVDAVTVLDGSEIRARMNEVTVQGPQGLEIQGPKDTIAESRSPPPQPTPATSEPPFCLFRTMSDDHKIENQ